MTSAEEDYRRRMALIGVENPPPMPSPQKDEPELKIDRRALPPYVAQLLADKEDYDRENRLLERGGDGRDHLSGWSGHMREVGRK